jgi:hypothetical protein
VGRVVPGQGGDEEDAAGPGGTGAGCAAQGTGLARE